MMDILKDLAILALAALNVYQGRAWLMEKLKGKLLGFVSKAQ
jgi:hypothetical protein